MAVEVDREEGAGVDSEVAEAEDGVVVVVEEGSRVVQCGRLVLTSD